MCPIWKRCWPAKDLANAFLNASGGRQFWSLYWNCVKITWKIRQNYMTLGETTAIGTYVLAKKQKVPYGIHLSFPIEGKTPMSTTLEVDTPFVLKTQISNARKHLQRKCLLEGLVCLLAKFICFYTVTFCLVLDYEHWGYCEFFSLIDTTWKFTKHLIYTRTNNILQLYLRLSSTCRITLVQY